MLRVSVFHTYLGHRPPSPQNREWLTLDTHALVINHRPRTPPPLRPYRQMGAATRQQPAITLRLLERVAPRCSDDHGAWLCLGSVASRAEHSPDSASIKKRRPTTSDGHEVVRSHRCMAAWGRLNAGRQRSTARVASTASAMRKIQRRHETDVRMTPRSPSPTLGGDEVGVTARLVVLPRLSSGHWLQLFNGRTDRRLLLRRRGASEDLASPRHRDGFELVVVAFHVVRSTHNNRVTDRRHPVR